VRSKRRRQILNGDSSRHGSVLKKRKVAKHERSACQRLNSAASADGRDAADDDQLHSELASDEKQCPAADEDIQTDDQQLHEAVQPTTLVRYFFLYIDL